MLPTMRLTSTCACSYSTAHDAAHQHLRIASHGGDKTAYRRRGGERLAARVRTLSSAASRIDRGPPCRTRCTSPWMTRGTKP